MSLFPNQQKGGLPLTEVEGFTLIEVLVVIAILTLVAMTAFFSLSKVTSAQAVDKGAALVNAVLSQARSLTLGSKESSQYGVHFDATGPVLFKGGTYSPFDSANISTPVDGRSSLGNITLVGGGNEVIFSRLSGKVINNGSLRVSLTADPTVFKTVIIYASGLSEIN